MTEEIMNAWVGSMQNEIGVLTTNLMLAELKIDSVVGENTRLTDHIEALTNRCHLAEADNQALKEQIQPHRKKK